MTKDEVEELIQEVFEHLLDGGKEYDGPLDIPDGEFENGDVALLLDRLGIR